ncbi:MAG: hypothetical protein ACLSFT_04195 [Ruminococcus callidus]
MRQLLKIDGKYIRAYITRVEMGGIFGTIVLLVDVTYNVKAEKCGRNSPQTFPTS